MGQRDVNTWGPYCVVSRRKGVKRQENYIRCKERERNRGWGWRCRNKEILTRHPFPHLLQVRQPLTATLPPTFEETRRNQVTHCAVWSGLSYNYPPYTEYTDLDYPARSSLFTHRLCHGAWSSGYCFNRPLPRGHEKSVNIRSNQPVLRHWLIWADFDWSWLISADALNNLGIHVRIFAKPVYEWCGSCISHTMKKGTYASHANRGDSDQPAKSLNLIKAFAYTSIYSWVSTGSVSRHWRPWSDCADAQSDLGLRCPHMPQRHFFTWCDLCENVGLPQASGITVTLNFHLKISEMPNSRPYARCGQRKEDRYQHAHSHSVIMAFTVC